MLKKRWSRSAWTSVTVQSRQYSPSATASLSSQSACSRSGALGREQDDERDDRRRGDDDRGDRDQRPVAAGLGEVPSGRAGVTGLLGQPPEPGGDLGLVGCGRPSIGFAIGPLRGTQVALADAGRRHVPPGRIGRWRLADLDGGFPRRDGADLVVEPVASLAQPEQGGGRDGRVVEADDALVVDRGVPEVAGREQLVAAHQQALGGLAREASRGHLASASRTSWVVHRRDST